MTTITITITGIDRDERVHVRIVEEGRERFASLGMPLLLSACQQDDGELARAYCAIRADATVIIARRRQEERERAIARMTGCRAHAPAETGGDYCFTACVACHPFTECDPRAHGCISVVEACQSCGATRAVNRNQGFIERGTWLAEGLR